MVIRVWRLSIVILLFLFLALQFLIPARLVIGGLGAVGRPSVAVGILLAFVWLVSAVRQRQLPAGRQPIRWLIGFYLMVQLVGLAVGYDRGLPEAEATSAQRWTIYIVSMIGVALAMAEGLKTRRQLDTVLRGLVGFAGFMAFVGTLQYFRLVDLTQYIRIPGLRTNSDLIGVAARGDGGFSRVAGTANHYIEFGVVLALVLPLAIHYAVFSPKGVRRVLSWVLVALIGSAIPFSISRAAIVTVAVTMLLMVTVWTWRTRYNAAVIIVVAMGAFHVVNRGLLGTIRSLFTNLDNDPSIQNRLGDTAYVWQLFDHRPWLGRGPGTFLPASYRLLDNQLYGTLIVGGVLGMLALLLLFMVPYLMGRSMRLRGSDQETRHLGQALAVVFPAALVASGTFDSFGFATFLSVVFIAVGAVGALWRLSGASPTRPMQAAQPGDKWVATPMTAHLRDRIRTAFAATRERPGIRTAFEPMMPIAGRDLDREDVTYDGASSQVTTVEVADPDGVGAEGSAPSRGRHALSGAGAP
ncbi:O-antigen ligase [Occultella aeris]|uniref:O-Antigen ligase n=1 Tax=Occultella aeris TaxID=2761496 RepID=A0A7M4DI75_9MICO|nr:O-Antigen ligase [Occultella aeris]